MKIWLDVTTIVGWARPPVGIVRNEMECARYFLEHESDRIHFCRFDAPTSRYIVVDLDYVRDTIDRLDGRGLTRLSNGQPEVPPPEPPPPPAPVPLTKEQRIKALLKDAIESLPEGPRDRAQRFASERREAFYALMRAARELRTAARTMLRRSIPAPDPSTPWVEPARQVPELPLIFGPGDVVVSMGLDWDQKYLVYLYGLKKQLGFKVLLFCYDLIPVKFPHLCVGDVASLFGRYFADVAWCADSILCISKCSRNDLESFLREIGAPVPRLEVVKLGSKLPGNADAEPSPAIAHLVGKRFVLFVSTIERRKNHETLYRAYTRLVDGGRKDLPMLVFVGMQGWGVNDLMLDLNLDPRIKPYVSVLNHVSDDDLGYLYRHAYLTAYPSLFEGWGLPVAEALSYGKFCLASNAASIPEVGGDLLEYLDPWAIQDWADRLAWYFERPEAVAEREARIRAEYKPTSWDDTGRFVLDRALGLGEGVPA